GVPTSQLESPGVRSGVELDTSRYAGASSRLRVLGCHCSRGEKFGGMSSGSPEDGCRNLPRPAQRQLPNRPNRNVDENWRRASTELKTTGMRASARFETWGRTTSRATLYEIVAPHLPRRRRSCDPPPWDQDAR